MKCQLIKSLIAISGCSRKLPQLTGLFHKDNFQYTNVESHLMGNGAAPGTIRQLSSTVTSFREHNSQSATLM
jgi:hypothetical protein